MARPRCSPRADHERGDFGRLRRLDEPFDHRADADAQRHAGGACRVEWRPGFLAEDVDRFDVVAEGARERPRRHQHRVHGEAVVECREYARHQ